MWRLFFKQQLSSGIPRIINYTWNSEVIILRCFVLLCFLSTLQCEFGCPAHTFLGTWLGGGGGGSLLERAIYRNATLSLLPCT